MGSAVARPQTTLFGHDAYADIWTKAAALLQSIVNNHPLIDGNKRLGWLATSVFLEINEIGVTHVDNDAVYEFVMWVAASNPSFELITERLKALVSETPSG